jgi:hypothetical protein
MRWTGWGVQVIGLWARGPRRIDGKIQLPPSLPA